jgi:hypothetical protein
MRETFDEEIYNLRLGHVERRCFLRVRVVESLYALTLILKRKKIRMRFFFRPYNSLSKPATTVKCNKRKEKMNNG